MLIRLDESSERAIYAQIADSVRADIAEGRVTPGMTLAPARQVAAALGINVHTVLRAYQQLRDERLVDLRRGRGAVVTAAASTLVELHSEITGLVARARALGVSAETVAAMVANAGPTDPPPADGPAFITPAQAPQAAQEHRAA